MYEKYLVVIPLENEGVTVKKIKGVRYVYYTFDRNYSSEKHYTVPKATTIGKCDEATDGMRWPSCSACLERLQDTDIRMSDSFWTGGTSANPT